MSIKVDITNRIRQELEAGVFNEITYDKVTKEAVEGSHQAPTVVINIDSGSLSGSSAGPSRRYTGARLEGVTITALARFKSEVDVTTFMATGLKFPIRFRSEGALVEITSGSFMSMQQPPRQGAQNGTHLHLTLTANIRR